MLKNVINKIRTKFQIAKIGHMNLEQLMTDGQGLTNENTTQAVTTRFIHLIKTECPYEVVLGHKVYLLPALNAFVPVAAVIPLPDFVFISMNTECKLPLEIKEAIVAHEIGHIKHGHTDMSVAEQVMHERIQCLHNGTVHQSELDADAYAASVVGTTTFIDALNYMSTLPCVTDEDKVEIQNRIKALS